MDDLEDMLAVCERHEKQLQEQEREASRGR